MQRRRGGVELQIIGSAKTKQSMDLANSPFPRPAQVVDWPRGSFDFDGLTIELHGFEWAAHTDDHAAWLLKQDQIIHAPDLINAPQRGDGGLGNVRVPVNAVPACWAGRPK